MGRARRERIFYGAIAAIFSIGFGAGVATVRLVMPDTDGSRAALDQGAGAAAVRAVASSAEPDRDTSTSAAAKTVPRPNSLVAIASRAAPDPDERATAAAGAGADRTRGAPGLVELPPPGDSRARPQLASLTPPPGDLDGLTRGARMTEQARLDKAVLSAEPFATEQIVVQRGDTLMNILTTAGIARGEAYAAISALSDIYDPRRLRAGQELLLTAAAVGDDEDASRQLLRLAFDLDFDHEIRVARAGDGAFAGQRLERPQRRELVHRAGDIDGSFYLSADRAAVPQDLIVELIKLFSWDVDFQRDVHPGDAFEATFEEVALAQDATAVRAGELLHARLTLSGRDLDAYRFEREDGTIEYFDRTGRSLRKFLLRTPVDGARISSRFGRRTHPILGYSRMHEGVDFAAPSGTPVFAAGNGSVATAGRNGGYGNYIRLRHNGEYSTAYAHLSRFAKNVKRGARVEQGQIIGYVGTTGRSTGPHLHYEVLRHGSQINPLTLKHPALAQLGGAELESFQAEVARIDRLRTTLQNGTQLASRGQRAAAEPQPN